MTNLSIVIFLLFSISTSHAAQWQFYKGNENDLLNRIEGFIGETKVANCRFIVEKIAYAYKDRYWVTVIDEARASEIAFELVDTFESNLGHKVLEQDFVFSRQSSDLEDQKIEAISILFDESYLSSFEYREFYKEPFSIKKVVRCGRF